MAEHGGMSQQISKEEARGSLLLWFGVLAAPLAWGVQLVVNYSLEEWFACSSSAEERGVILSLGVKSVATLVNVAMTAVAAAGGLVAYLCLRRIKAQPRDPTAGGRAGWMAVVGLINTFVFLPLILPGFAPPLFLDVCQTLP